ncbi:MAG: hypothetical protein OEQ18_00710 [Gammaproteobacteria bacterium]|nr:hypothetical protein [Gammaproteobacteria bacterium]
MGLNYNHGVVLIADETVPGTAEALVAGDGGMIVSNITYNANPKPIDRNAIISNKGQIASLMSPAWEPSIEFDTELKGGGTPLGVAPKVGQILQMANFSETIVASTTVTYELDGADNHKTLAWDLKDDTGANGPRFLIYGALCGLSISLGIEKPGSIRVKGLGKYQAPADVAPLTPTLELLAPPFFMGGTFTIDGDALNVREFSMDTNPELFLIPKISDAQGFQYARISKLKPTFSVTCELPGIATQDIYAIMRAATEIALSIATPAVAGNTITISATKLQYTGIALSEDRGIPLATITGQINYGGASHFKMVLT